MGGLSLKAFETNSSNLFFKQWFKCTWLSFGAWIELHYLLMSFLVLFSLFFTSGRVFLLFHLRKVGRFGYHLSSLIPRHWMFMHALLHSAECQIVWINQHLWLLKKISYSYIFVSGDLYTERTAKNVFLHLTWSGHHLYPTHWSKGESSQAKLKIKQKNDYS